MLIELALYYPRSHAKLVVTADLLEYAATSMPTDVYQYAHNNAFTMLSFGVAVLLQVSGLRNAGELD